MPQTSDKSLETTPGSVKPARQSWAKRALDVVSSATGLLLLLPVLGCLSVWIRLTMGSPIFFRQPRPGLGGEVFGLIKFRSMRDPRPGEEGPDFDTQRITRLGRLMRSTSLDELPTLWNVLTGDMSLVGPRPLLVRYLERYSPTQARRHEVRPGITGWAQIHGRNVTSWDARLAYDIYYVDNQSFLLDLKILIGTIKPVLFRSGIQHEGHGTMPEFLGTQVEDTGDKSASSDPVA
ncbi:MAG: sugar transferase [Myxococcota bacterium]|nr:sugar transferase [Myxococcota bacterium]